MLFCEGQSASGVFGRRSVQSEVLTKTRSHPGFPSPSGTTGMILRYTLLRFNGLLSVSFVLLSRVLFTERTWMLCVKLKSETVSCR